MFKLSNDRQVDYVAASGSYGFGFWGLGWLWDKPLIWLGFMQPKLFTIILRTLTWEPRLYPVSNLSWWRVWTWLPWSKWSCIKFLPNDGSVNKVGLYNPGFLWWYTKVAPKLNFIQYKIIVSLHGTREDLVRMVKLLEKFSLVAIEINVSCPNSENPDEEDGEIIATVREVRMTSRHPIFLKLGYDKEGRYLKVAKAAAEYLAAIDLNAVKWEIVFGDKSSPLSSRLRGPGHGGVSGKPAQKYNWEAVEKLVEQKAVPIIASSIMSYDDLVQVKKLKPHAVSFGAIHMRKPWLPTQIVLQDMQARAR